MFQWPVYSCSFPASNKSVEQLIDQRSNAELAIEIANVTKSEPPEGKTVDPIAAAAAAAKLEKSKSELIAHLDSKHRASREIEKTLARSGLKGQFGDFFATFSSFATVLSLLFVYKSLLQSKKEVKKERYYSEVAASIASYRRAVELILAPDVKGKNWNGPHGLFHLWHHAMSKVCLARKSAYWVPIANKFCWVSEADASICKSTNESVYDQMLKQFLANSNLSMQEIRKTRETWMSLYETHHYQLTPFFRSWFHVFKIISDAPNFDVEREVEFAVAERFIAGLSTIEVTMLLANQVYSNAAGGDGYAEARKYCEKYGIFSHLSAGIDPTIIITEMLARKVLTDKNAHSFETGAFR